MSDEIRKDAVVSGEGEEMKDLPNPEDVLPKDHETYTPQGGGAGTGSGPIREVAAVGDKASTRGSADVIPLPQVGPEMATAEALGLGSDAGMPAAGSEEARGFPLPPPTDARVCGGLRWSVAGFCLSCGANL